MSWWRNERGFTLAELLAAFAVLGLVLAAVTMIHQSILQTYVSRSNKTEVQQNVRIAIERMAREIRQTANVLTLATATSLTFLDQDTGVTTYALNGATLTRTANGLDEILIGRVQALTFAYRDVNNNLLGVPVGTPANVFRVDITVQTGSEDTIVAGAIGDTKAELTTSVRLRNL